MAQNDIQTSIMSHPSESITPSDVDNCEGGRSEELGCDNGDQTSRLEKETDEPLGLCSKCAAIDFNQLELGPVVRRVSGFWKRT